MFRGDFEMVKACSGVILKWLKIIFLVQNNLETCFKPAFVSIWASISNTLVGPLSVVGFWWD